MKNLIKIPLAFTLALFVFACSDNERLQDQVFENTTSGAMLRTLESSTDLSLGAENQKVELLLEVIDEKFGDLSERVDIFVSFQDRNNLDEDGNFTNENSIAEVFLSSIPASSFTTGGQFPTVSITVPLEVLENQLNIESDYYNGGDRFFVRLELHLTDGRVFTNSNTNQTIAGGAFYRSPFIYAANVVCPFDGESLAGSHTFVTSEMFRPGADPCGGTVTGTVVWSESETEGLYATSDFSFGLFESSCWNDAPATSDTAQLLWFCANIVPEGTDQYGENWAYTILSVNGPTMVIEFLSTRSTGEGGITTITREGGQDWPAIFQN